jgi:opacity protein-like surface antigen
MGTSARKLIRAASAIAFACGVLLSSHKVPAADLEPNVAPAWQWPEPPPIYNWTGLYAGGVAGYQGGFASGLAMNPPLTGPLKPQGGGFSGGALAGFNWQIPSWWEGGSIVVGLEADIGGSTQSGSQTTVVGSENFVGTARNPWSGTMRARVGLPFGTFGNWLVYATAGAGVGKFDLSTAVSGATANGVLDGSSHRAIWTVGGGLEYALNRYWSLRTEYLYVDTGAFTDQPPSLSGVTVKSTRVIQDIVRTGFAYHF